jgi:hypothetical protein
VFIVFDYTSRYYNLPETQHTLPSGRIVTYKRRRFLPVAASLPLLAEVQPQQGERLDLLTWRTLGDPLQFWRICDANDVVDPFALIEESANEEDARRIRVPVPQP